jgi:hypothetical protein
MSPCRETKVPLGLLAAALLALCLAACGGSGRQTARPSGAAATDAASIAGRDYINDDEDAPGDDNAKRDDGDDDEGTLKYGRAASSEEARAVERVVRSYYAAAAADRGTAACALIHARLAGRPNLEAALPVQYRPAPGSGVLRGKGCAQVEGLIFGLNHQQLVGEAATLRVKGVRVKGAGALAIMRFKTIGEREISLRRERATWKIDALVDQNLP